MKLELRKSLHRLGVGALVWSLLAASASARPQRTRPQAPPSASFTRSAPAQNRVLLIGLDGCRPDGLLAANTPNLDRLIAEGAYSDNASAIMPTLSGPNWTSLLTGVAAAKHGVTDNSFAGANFAAYPHFFVRIKERRPSTFTASFTQWNAIHTEIVSGADVSMGGLTDIEVALQAANLIAGGDPQVMFLHLNEVDIAGHAFGFTTLAPEYLAAIEVADARVGAVLAALEQRTATGMRRYEDWLVAVTSDHGGFLQSHGGNSIPELRTWLILSGPTIVDGAGIFPGTHSYDVTATIFDHLRIEPAPEWGLDGVSQMPDVRVLR